MEVILREDVDKLGHRGQVVKVAAGYARNFLLPRNLAVPATGSNKNIVEQERQAGLRRDAKEISAAQELAKLMSGLALETTQKSGENEQLFGSVTAQDIAHMLEQKGYTIDRRKIVLEHPIKQLGEHKVAVKLHREVSAEITVNVVKEEE